MSDPTETGVWVQNGSVWQFTLPDHWWSVVIRPTAAGHWQIEVWNQLVKRDLVPLATGDEGIADAEREKALDVLSACIDRHHDRSAAAARDLASIRGAGG